MARADEAFLFLKFVAKMFDRTTAKFAGFLGFPFAPAVIAEKIVERGLVRSLLSDIAAHSRRCRAGIEW